MPEADTVILPSLAPAQLTPLFVVVMVGSGLTVTVTGADLAIHPFALVTVTI